MFLRDPADRREQVPHVHREAPIHSAGGRRVGQPEANEAATDRAGRSLRATHRDERSAGDELAAHGRLTGAWLDGGQRARDLRRAEPTESERRGPDQVVPQHVRGPHGEQAGVPLARARQRVGHRDPGRSHRHRDVREVGRLEADLGIHVRPLRHAHARGWKRRYICSTAVDGRCV